MIKVTFKEPVTVFENDIAIAVLFVFCSLVKFTNFHLQHDFFIINDVLTINDGAEYIQSIEHVKPTEI